MQKGDEIMADVKWIKIVTDIFDNRKIRQIEKMPEGDSIIVIWMKLLCLAADTNDKGYVYFTEEIPYTEQMLATQFDRPLSTVQLALRTFQSFKMIDIINDIIHVSSWERYQNAEGLDKIREQTRKRVAAHRARQKNAMLEDSKRYCNVTETHGNAIDKDIDIDKDKDIDIDKEKENKAISISDDIDMDSVSDETHSPEKKPKKKDKPVKHKYGEYNNVLLTDEELSKLKTEFPDWENRIERLSLYIESKGAKYKSHYATILAWDRRDTEQRQKTPGTGQYGPQTGYKKTGTAEELDEFYKMVAAWAEEGENT